MKMNFLMKVKLIYKVLVILALLAIFLVSYLLIYLPPIPYPELRSNSEEDLANAVRIEKQTGCEIPHLDPFAPEIMNFFVTYKPIVCYEPDWVECKGDVCSVQTEIVKDAISFNCIYTDIIYVSDGTTKYGSPTTVYGTNKYYLKDSDHVIVSCRAYFSWLRRRSWYSVISGLRPIRTRNHSTGMGYNILIVLFDSLSRNGFLREMPRSYEVLKTRMQTVFMMGYNIVGDGTPAALFPILTGKTEFELPETRRSAPNSTFVDVIPFLWYLLKAYGYKTAFFEDLYYVGTFQYRLNGFKNMPTDHYLRPYFKEYYRKVSKDTLCSGGRPTHEFMLNLTQQFVQQKGKLFIFTFIGCLSHDKTLLHLADDYFSDWLVNMQKSGVLDNTLFVVMGDHGPRFSELRNTLQGKLEERLPLLAVTLPKNYVRVCPQCLQSLKSNADVLTVPFDLHATFLDIANLSNHKVPYTVPGSDTPRSMSLLRPISRNRSCPEAGVEAHWCSCVSWQQLNSTDPMVRNVAEALVNYINRLTSELRNMCAFRKLVSIESVSKKIVKEPLLKFIKSKSNLRVRFGDIPHYTIEHQEYSVKIVASPENAIYEATVKYNANTKHLTINNKDISRINAYGHNPDCISTIRPDLNMYCYCKK